DGISELYNLRDDYPRAVAARRKSLEIREAALGPDNPDVALSIQGLAYLALDHGDCAEAMQLSRRALAILERSKSPEHHAINSINALASCEVKTGRLAEGRARFEQLLALVDRPNAANIDQRTQAYLDFADVLYPAGERARARKLIEAAQALFA